MTILIIIIVSLLLSLTYLLMRIEWQETNENGQAREICVESNNDVLEGQEEFE